MKLSMLSDHAASIRIEAKEAASLLQGLEAQRSELGVVAEELIALLRQAGISAQAGMTTQDGPHLDSQ